MKCLLCNKKLGHVIGGKDWSVHLKYCLNCYIKEFKDVPKFTKEDVLSLARKAKEDSDIQDNFEELNNL